MTAKVSDVIQAIEYLFPRHYAAQWDNSGLQVGRQDWPARRVWVALDPSVAVVENACEQHVDLLITHHPLIFKPLKHIDFNSGTGTIIQQAASHRLSIYSAHTNLDSVEGGVNDVLAKSIGLENIHVLENDDVHPVTMPARRAGLGRIGEFEKTLTMKSLIRTVKQKLGLKYVKVAGDLDLNVKRVAVCGGSGSSLIQTFMASDADVYLSGDLHYHDALAIKEVGRGLIDVGHFASEHLVLPALAGMIRHALGELQFDTTVEVYERETDPFVTV